MAFGRVYVATEDDDVYALDAHDGHVLWHANVGTPLTQVDRFAGCGDIDPLGITSTPAIDTATGTLYVVAEVSNGADPPTVHHQLVGFNAYTGQVVRSADADPTGGGDSIINLQQRGALALGRGRVYVSYGGLAGDCGFYHGWVVGVSETAGPGTVEFNATPGQQGGAIWEPGGPAIDSVGNVYVSTGNRNNPDDPNVPYAESVVKLSPSLDLEAHFTDGVATGDDDLSTDSPSLPTGRNGLRHRQDRRRVSPPSVGPRRSRQYPRTSAAATLTAATRSMPPRTRSSFRAGEEAFRRSTWPTTPQGRGSVPPTALRSWSTAPCGR